MKLNSTALTSGQTTDSYRTTHFGSHSVQIVGNTDGEVLTLQSSVDNVTFTDFMSPSPVTGLPETHAITLSAGTKVFGEVATLPGGFYWRWSMSSNGHSPSGVFIHVDGDNLAAN